jgi:phosphoribosylanthranilate isomerase
MRVKVCGNTEIDQVKQLDAMGVDFAGFIFYPKSPRYVVRHLTGEQVKRARLRLGKVGVFVNASYDDVMKQVDAYGLDMIQLHGDETPRLCEQLANYITVIKVFRMGENDPIEWLIRPYQDSCGGIEPGDVERLKAFEKEPVARKLFAIDINSKFETSPGVKDLKKIRAFLDGVKSANR